MNSNLFKSFTSQFDQTIPHHLLQSTVKKILSKMNLVTREEFDIQQQVLNKTRLKLIQLEEQIAVLETEYHQLKAKLHACETL